MGQGGVAFPLKRSAFAFAHTHSDPSAVADPSGTIPSLHQCPGSEEAERILSRCCQTYRKRDPMMFLLVGDRKAAARNLDDVRLS
jgi:hypothetical protein